VDYVVHESEHVRAGEERAWRYRRSIGMLDLMMVADYGNV